MTVTRATAEPEPEPPFTNLEQLVDHVLTSAVEPATRRLLHIASNGDPALLRALVMSGLADGTLTWQARRWRWAPDLSRASRISRFIESRAAGMPPQQVAALRMIAAAWAEPFAAVTQILGDRPVPDAPGTAVGLTRREREILTMLGNGLNARTIAQRLCLSQRTVAKHQERVYRKLGTSDRLTTVLRAQRLGLLKPAAPTPGEES
ncbi:response regulator transcription factor [Dactylosporangium roseum]|uniref:Response regulator transcription factor n=1 Tax=Dactylosporangium roseum TaxID=47989 RepID=A0ABY5Z8D9_9ACTN|nr:LuxR C-terminal-related transcriptional regulator [Dactylosporangium roseum]UWZ37092.1 response regulator transcription factor [Dactylosporangium roseum]